MKTNKLDFKNFNLNTFAAKLLIISRSYQLVEEELLLDKDKFNHWCVEICAKNFVLDTDVEIKGCMIYLQAYLLNIPNNKFYQLLNQNI